MKKYTKPVLVKIEIVPGETVSLGCWRAAPSSC